MSAGIDQNGPAPEDPATGPASSVPRPSGLVLSPFRALRYDTDRAGDLSALTSPPYDVIDADGVAALEATSEHNVVRLILPREDPESGQDRYARAAATLAAWRADGVLVPDEQAALYVYEQAAPGGHVQRGLLGALALTPPEDEIVLPHENTMAGPVSDRLALYTAVDADLEPIFLVYDGGGAASRAVASVDAASPTGAPADGGTPAPRLLVDASLADGLRHRLWAITDRALLAEVAADLHPRKALIADGHHRYATYLRRQADRHGAGDGAGPWDSGLCLLVDATAFGPEVHPIHRFVPGVDPDELAQRTSVGAAVRQLSGDLDSALAALAEAGTRGPAFLLVAGDGSRLHLVTEPDPERLAAAVPPERSAAWAALDVSVLHAYLVTSLWGLPDDTEHVGYEHDVEGALTAAARTGGTAVLLNPTPVEAVAQVAGSGERMPRKSTLFTPKPSTGLVIRDHRDA
ncbi:MAG: hypothetical protein JWM62_1410 [Frankiales bacterium]|nr:hypothetical protein [Frankiales bacterium]